MEAGKYTISIRAIGYELPGTSVDVTAQPAQLDLRLNKVASGSKVAMHPWMRPSQGPISPATTGQIAAGKYFSSINLSSADTFEFPLKTLPRPKGKATQVIYTVYDLPRPDASPHDEVFDAQGNVWYSDFNSQFFGKLDPKTGKVVEYAVPQARFGQLAQGGLQIDVDKEGRIYFGNMARLL